MEDNKFLDPNAPISSKEAHNILIKAFNGDPVAVYAIFSRINMHVEPSENIPEEFLLYFLLKSNQLRSQKNIQALTSALPKKKGRKKTHLEKAKMVNYLREYEHKTTELAIRQVAENIGTDPDIIKNACYQWPKEQRKKQNKGLSPIKTAELLPWAQKIHTKQQYRDALSNILNINDSPYTLNDIQKAAFRQSRFSQVEI